MSQKIFDCKKFSFPEKPLKIYLLLASTSTLTIWLLATPSSSYAQVVSNIEQTSTLQASADSLLPVPSSPALSTKSNQGASRVPPPPLSPIPGKTGVAVAPAIKPLPPSVQPQPAESLFSLENSFIQGKKRQEKPKADLRSSSEVQTNQSVLVAGENVSGLGLETTSVSASNLGLIRPSESPRTLEFQSEVVPLPPLPGQQQVAIQQNNQQARSVGTASSTTPTFTQLLNSQPTQPAPVTAQSVNGGATNYQAAPVSMNYGTAPVNNQQFNYQTPTPAPTFGQQLNSQTAPIAQQPPAPQPERSVIKSTALREPSLQAQGVYVTQGGNTSARARLSGIYPLTPQALFGATLDLTSEGSTFDDSRTEGLNINELFFATSLTGLPNLRFVVGQMDLTSYFDRNSFAKDGSSQFFNPIFQTNPALSATGIASRPGLLVNWSVNDNIEAKAAVFSSSNRLSDFTLDGFAGEIGVRYGNSIIRATYATDRDSGVRDAFPESFRVSRGDNRFGPLKDDREEAYGLNAEVFIPNLKLGLFGRYGRYQNRDLPGKSGADTYLFGATLVDLFTPDDRLGIAYGRGLSNGSTDDLEVLETYYDFQFLPNLRVGFTIQGRDSFEDTIVGVRVKTDFDVTPRGRIAR